MEGDIATFVLLAEADSVYLRHCIKHLASMKIVLDNLIHDKLLTEIVVAFTQPGERLIEYPNDPDHAK